MTNQDIQKVIKAYEENMEKLKELFEQEPGYYTKEMAETSNRICRIVDILAEEGLTEVLDY